MTASGACGACGSVLHANARFCDQCGSPAAGSRGTAEYKQVTVLFADVVRSMGIAAALDPERLREVMTDLVEHSAAVARRYGGSVEYNGDGVMALFGAPIALEDHAFRACLAALDIQEEARRLAHEVKQRDGIDFGVRVGLNSGRVIVGEVGKGAFGYRATGETVGLAQRMESVAPTGGVMLSESTARLVESSVTLGDLEWLHIKGADEPVRGRRLVAAGPGDRRVARSEAKLVGRRWEMAVLDAIAERANEGRGAVVRLVGPPGIGKSRIARETAALMAERGVEVVWTFCGSHAAEIPFHVVGQLLRAGTGVAGLGAEDARKQLRALLPDVDPHDLLLLDDLLGVADVTVSLPQIDPDARRRRLTALVNTASLARTDPVLFVVEDVHWIDGVSESMLAEFLTVIPRTAVMVLFTFRPEYDGALARTPAGQTISLSPLGSADSAALIAELLGSDPSVDELSVLIGERAGGNPFFTEEMVRELAQRGVLDGEHGRYVCIAAAAEVSIPATVQAAITARIDRLSDAAKRTLNAAAVIGVTFDAELLASLGVQAAVDELLDVELIDQVRFTPDVEYAFRHPLIQAVAYESQLKSDRAVWHRRLAEAIEQRAPELAEENAAMIAEHLEAAGDLRSAFAWHMRAGGWSADREVSAARLSWERACHIADGLRDDAPDVLSLRIAPRTMLCVTDFQARTVEEWQGRFAELRELCDAAGDKVSLAIGMTGRVSELLYASRAHEASALASEQMALLESIGDPALTAGLSFVAFACWYDAGEFEQILRWSDTVMALADGDPAKGAGFGFGSPLAAAVAFHGVARWWLGLPGWREHLSRAFTMAHDCDPTTFGYILAWTIGLEIAGGVLVSDDATVATIEQAVVAAEKSSNDNAVMLAEYSLGVALTHRDSASERERGIELLEGTLVMLKTRVPSLVSVTELWVARERARGGDGAVISAMRQAVDDMIDAGRIGYCVFGSATLVETLLDRGEGDGLIAAQEVIERLENLGVQHDVAMLKVTVLRLRAMLAGIRDEDGAYLKLASEYRAMAESLGFEGHIRWAKAMTDS